MWITTKNSLLSITQHPNRPNDVVLQANRKGDISRLFPKKAKNVTLETGTAYKYMLIVSKKELAKVVSDYILRNLTYKDFVAAQDKDSSAWSEYISEAQNTSKKLQE